MNNPLVIEIPQNIWTKVATGITIGTIHKTDSLKSKTPTSYLQTFRLTGEAAPTEISPEAALMFLDKEGTEDISSTAPIDVYITARGATGELRVNI